MLDSVLASAAGSITLAQILVCTAVSLALGLVVALVFMFRNQTSKNLVFTIILLPAMVQAVIMLVNGNLGVGVAVAGAFSLVRFRSAPGTAKDITAIFFAMAIGLATGMGYIWYAVLFTVVVGTAMLLCTLLRVGERGTGTKSLKVTIPEDLDYTGLFDDLFRRYTKAAELERVKTTNLGSLFELQYTIVLKDPALEKEFLDKIRQRNGNLNISCGRMLASREEL